MGRRTLRNPRLKVRRGDNLQDQVFALRRAMACKAQVVRNQQRQIEIVKQMLRNLELRLGVLEQPLAMAVNYSWSEDEGAGRLPEVLIRRLDPLATTKDVSQRPNSFHLMDDLHDAQLHPYDADRPTWFSRLRRWASGLPLFATESRDSHASN